MGWRRHLNKRQSSSRDAVSKDAARRVLRSNGHYLLVSFDRLELDPVPKAVGNAVAALFPDDPPAYMERGPFSYVDPALIEDDLLAAGFTHVKLETVARTSRVTARDAAMGMVLGSPLRSKIERRDSSGLDRALNAVSAALARWDGIDGPMSAHVVTATKCDRGARATTELSNVGCPVRVLDLQATR